MHTKNKLITKVANSQYYRLNYLKRSVFDIFSVEHIQEDIECFLFQKSILIKIWNQKDEEDLFLSIQFDAFLLVEIERIAVHQQHQEKIKIVIHFYKLQEKIQITSKNCGKETDEWIQYLKQHLNQRGFHKTFKPLKKIGKGSYASIYLIEDTETKQKYAAKAFSKLGIFSQNKQQQSLQKEISIMRILKHKNLVRLYGVYQTEHSLYLIEQLFDGGRLSERMAHKRFSMFQIVLLLRSITEGLVFMHKHKIMHRDIKPQNILFRRQGEHEAVLADFGLAQWSQASSYLFVRCGTPGYVAPEIVCIQDRSTRYSEACDIFSLGVIFYQLLARRPLFEGKDDNEVLASNKTCSFSLEPLKEMRVSASALDLLQKMLQKNPQNRITASQILQHNFLKPQTLTQQRILKNFSIQSDSNRKNSILGFSSDLHKVQQGSLSEQNFQKFKLKQNMSVGSSIGGEVIDKIQSPQQRQTRRTGFRPESRFKRRRQN